MYKDRRHNPYAHPAEPAVQLLLAMTLGWVALFSVVQVCNVTREILRKFPSMQYPHTDEQVRVEGPPLPSPACSSPNDLQAPPVLGPLGAVAPGKEEEREGSVKTPEFKSGCT